VPHRGGFTRYAPVFSPAFPDRHFHPHGHPVFTPQAVHTQFFSCGFSFFGRSFLPRCVDPARFCGRVPQVGFFGWVTPPRGFSPHGHACCRGIFLVFCLERPLFGMLDFSFFFFFRALVSFLLFWARLTSGVVASLEFPPLKWLGGFLYFFGRGKYSCVSTFWVTRSTLVSFAWSHLFRVCFGVELVFALWDCPRRGPLRLFNLATFVFGFFGFNQGFRLSRCLVFFWGGHAFFAKGPGAGVRKPGCGEYDFFFFFGHFFVGGPWFGFEGFLDPRNKKVPLVLQMIRGPPLLEVKTWSCLCAFLLYCCTTSLFSLFSTKVSLSFPFTWVFFEIMGVLIFFFSFF